jgi:hypothetical protein
MSGSGWIAAVHLIGMAMLVGAVAVFDLRVLGLARSIPVRSLARLCLPWAVASLLLIVPSGSLLFVARATELLTSSLFLAKLGLLLLALILAVAFHAGPYGSVDRWDVETPAPWLAKLIAAASLLVWIAVIVAGRMLAD